MKNLVHSENLPIFSPSDFVASLNQTFEFTYGSILVEGELSNYKISKNRWVYFDLKDELSSIKCFATVFQLPAPLQDGLKVQVLSQPKLHPRFGFSLNVSNIKLVGEGSIKKASELLFLKLDMEGLFELSRKRELPYAPERIGLISSIESAAYGDFIKIINERFSGLNILAVDVLVQGINAASQVSLAIAQLNQMANPPEVIVITRGGGSADDLSAFNDERLVRAIAASRIPTLIAIGHEVDVSLAELAADQRASTPSNAVQLLVPDKNYLLQALDQTKNKILSSLTNSISSRYNQLTDLQKQLYLMARHKIDSINNELNAKQKYLLAMDPKLVLKRGYSLIFQNNKLISSVTKINSANPIIAELSDGIIELKFITVKTEKL